MAVLEISAIHSKYVRTADRFKAIWTFHQFVSGVYKNLLHEPLPYSFEFQAVYEQIKKVGASIGISQVEQASASLDSGIAGLDVASELLLAADDRIGPSVLRRFFEKLKRQDETIVFYLVKFYLYSDAVEGDRRDKLDFLFTRIGEEFIEDRSDHDPRVTPELRMKFAALVSVMRRADPPDEDIERVVHAIHAMRTEIGTTDDFDDLTDRGLLKIARNFKHQVGDLYFHPDVLVSVVELNIVTKRRFSRLYESEEQRIMADAQRLTERAEALEENFGDNPSLLDELARFREQKEHFDALRAESNIKHDVIAALKASMASILAQVDRGLESDEEIEILDAPEIPEAFLEDAEQYDQICSRFRRDDPLIRYLVRISAAIDPAGRGHSPEQIAKFPTVRELRLERWEIAAFLKLFNDMQAEASEDTDELWMMYLRSAAMRVRIEEEATILSTAMAASIDPGRELLARTKESLDIAKELDEIFGEVVREAIYYSAPNMLRELYRSRFRLLRSFAGLWLLYDQHLEE